MKKSSENTGSYLPRIKTAYPACSLNYSGDKLFCFSVKRSNLSTRQSKKVNSFSLQCIFVKKMLECFILLSPARCMRGRAFCV